MTLQRQGKAKAQTPNIGMEARKSCFLFSINAEVKQIIIIIYRLSLCAKGHHSGDIFSKLA